MKTLEYYNLHVTGAGGGYLHGTILDRNGKPIYDIDMSDLEKNKSTTNKKYPVLAVDGVDIDIRSVDSKSFRQGKRGQDNTFDLTFSSDNESIVTIRLSEGDLKDVQAAIDGAINSIHKP